MASLEDKMALALAELEHVQSNATRIQEELDRASVTVLSKDRSVEVTVGAQNQLVALTFKGDRYRSMDGVQLSTTVMETVERARKQMADKVTAALRPLTERRGPFADLGPVPDMAPTGDPLPPSTQWDALFERLTNPPTPVLESGPVASARLRDEIVEEELEPSGTGTAEGETGTEAAPTQTASRRLLDEIVEDEAEQEPAATAAARTQTEKGS